MISFVPSVLRAPDLAVDLGTAVTRVASVKGLCEIPSKAQSVHALSHGVIANPHTAIAVLRPMLSAWRRSPFVRVRALACTPSDASREERKAVRDCVSAAGASAVAIVPEPLAAAVGAGIDIASTHVKLLVDIGSGVTDCALLHRGQVATSIAARVGCNDLRRAIQRRVRDAHAIKLSDDEAERLLRLTGLGDSNSDELPISIHRPRDSAVSVASLREAIFPVVFQMLNAIDTLLRELSPKFGAEVIEDGIFLSGGGALLRGLPAVIERYTGIDVRVVPDPLHSVIHGACAMLPIADSLRLWDSRAI
jgi:rod shape-determining protein MreB and related proteins